MPERDGRSWAGAEAARPEDTAAETARAERLGLVSYANVAPLHFGLDSGDEAEAGTIFVRGVPSELNASLLKGEIDLTLISSIEFLRYRKQLRALPDFSIATLGPVYSVMLFHRLPWEELSGARIAVTSESATSVELLRVLLQADGMEARLEPAEPDLDAMLADADGALLIGDSALAEGVARRSVAGRQPFVTDLGEAWYRLTRLPFTFAVWASVRDNPPSERLVHRLREARELGLAELGAVARQQSAARGLPERTMRRYLSNFRYYLEPPDRDGLLEFARRSIGEIEDELEFWDL